jgi:hypothetical protein
MRDAWLADGGRGEGPFVHRSQKIRACRTSAAAFNARAFVGAHPVGDRHAAATSQARSDRAQGALLQNGWFARCSAEVAIRAKALGPGVRRCDECGWSGRGPLPWRRFICALDRAALHSSWPGSVVAATPLLQEIVSSVFSVCSVSNIFRFCLPSCSSWFCLHAQPVGDEAGPRRGREADLVRP